MKKQKLHEFCVKEMRARCLAAHGMRMLTLCRWVSVVVRYHSNYNDTSLQFLLLGTLEPLSFVPLRMGSVGTQCLTPTRQDELLSPETGGLEA